MHIFRTFSEEKKAYFVAKAIVETRKHTPILTTGQLVTLIEESSFDPKSKTRIFQALRMEVNSELSVIETALSDAVDMLESGGRLSVISFHSVEDRCVKQTLQQYTKDIADPVTGQPSVPRSLKKVTKKPIVPTDAEIQTNPRARSAKLRVVEKI